MERIKKGKQTAKNKRLSKRKSVVSFTISNRLDYQKFLFFSIYYVLCYVQGTDCYPSSTDCYPSSTDCRPLRNSRNYFQQSSMPLWHHHSLIVTCYVFVSTFYSSKQYCVLINRDHARTLYCNRGSQPTDYTENISDTVTNYTRVEFQIRIRCSVTWWHSGNHIYHTYYIWNCENYFSFQLLSKL